MSLRLLYLTRESHPSFRPDLLTLFGEVLPALGVHSDLVALSADGKSAPWSGGNAFVRSATGRLGRTVARLRLALDLFRHAGQARYDAIQVRDRIFGALLGLLIARIRGLPFIYWMSFPFPDSWVELAIGPDVVGTKSSSRLAYFVRGKVSGWLLYRGVLRCADHIFVQSDEMGRMLSRRGIPAGRMTPVPMGVKIPASVESIAPADDARLAGRRVVAYLGALERVRHPEVMIEAIAIVREAFPDVLLVLVGDSQLPADRSWLRAQVAEARVQDHVVITGWLPPAEAWRYVRAARIGLSPFPRTPTFEVASPTKVCEYLAYGVPVVANDQPDQASLIAATGGGICVPLTARGFADGMLELLRDPERACSMGQRGREAVRGLRGYDVIGQTVADRYQTLFAGKRGVSS